MIHERDAQDGAFHAAGRHGGLDIRDESRRRLRPVGELPPQDVPIATHLRGIRIEEALAVKMFRKSGPPEYSSMNHRLFSHCARIRRAGTGTVDLRGEFLRHPDAEDRLLERLIEEYGGESLGRVE